MIITSFKFLQFKYPKDLHPQNILKMTRLGVGALVVVAIIAAELPDFHVVKIIQFHGRWVNKNNRNEYSCDNERNDDDTTKRNTKLLGALGPYAWPMAM
jgi:hypothetical protein